MAAVASLPASLRTTSSHDGDIAPSSSFTDRDLATYLQDQRFSQRFELPMQDRQTEPFVVTYSDFGYRNPLNPQKERVLLFCSPLMGRLVPFILC
jgi:hypothetical protein